VNQDVLVISAYRSTISTARGMKQVGFVTTGYRSKISAARGMKQDGLLTLV